VKFEVLGYITDDMNGARRPRPARPRVALAGELGPLEKRISESENAYQRRSSAANRRSCRVYRECKDAATLRRFRRGHHHLGEALTFTRSRTSRSGFCRFREHGVLRC